ncbi:MAG TPA: hypothetical protein VIO64_01375 [Pseudobacteroides sp.]|uniref:YkvI family membrane protein n=1 Tax=Pseudobacteroides sp. TaxID=1968840 RepID=UPI002F9330DD
MSEEIKNIYKVASIYVTTIIGAGFASGQEIARFFSGYYKGGFYGIVAAGVLFAIVGWFVLDRVYIGRIKNYEEFLYPTVGWVFGRVMDIVVTLFMFSVLSIMVAGLGSILSDKLSFSLPLGVTIMAFVCMLLMLTDIRGIVALSSLITPILILGIVFTGFYVIIFRDSSVFSMTGTLKGITNNWVLSSLIYVSYNSIMSVVVMSNMLPYLKTRKTGVLAGILGGVSLCAVALLLNTVINIFYSEVSGKDFPILTILEKYGAYFTSFYTFILWLAMFSSAVTSGYCLVDRIGSKVKINRKLITVLTCILIIPVSCFGFTNLIASLYTTFGYIGLFMVFAILFQEFKKA